MRGLGQIAGERRSKFKKGMAYGVFLGVEGFHVAKTDTIAFENCEADETLKMVGVYTRDTSQVLMAEDMLEALCGS